MSTLLSATRTLANAGYRLWLTQPRRWLSRPLHLPHLLGIRGERYAARYLTRCGYHILRRNWFGPLGEIDIIAVKNGALIVVEVKTRSHRSAAVKAPLDAIDSAKRRRLYGLAEYFYSRYKRQLSRFRIRSIRLETVGVRIGTDGKALITHEYDDE